MIGFRSPQLGAGTSWLQRLRCQTVTRQDKERVWFLLSLGYAALRVLGANAFLVKYGLNIAVFATIEFVSSAGLAFASARFVQSVVDRKHGAARGWFVAVIAGFATPDIYAIVVTHKVPPTLLALIAAMLLGSSCVALLGFRRRVRQARHESGKTPARLRRR